MASDIGEIDWFAEYLRGFYTKTNGTIKVPLNHVSAVTVRRVITNGAEARSWRLGRNRRRFLRLRRETTCHWRASPS